MDPKNHKSNCLVGYTLCDLIFFKDIFILTSIYFFKILNQTYTVQVMKSEDMIGYELTTSSPCSDQGSLLWLRG